LKEEIIVSGIIMSVLGKENSQGEFEVLDIYIAGLPEQIYPMIQMDIGLFHIGLSLFFFLLCFVLFAHI
jgi:hypothetical protein